MNIQLKMDERNAPSVNFVDGVSISREPKSCISFSAGMPIKGISKCFFEGANCACITERKINQSTAPVDYDDAKLNDGSENYVQCSCSGWPTGNGKKLSSSQAQLGQTTCLAVA